MLNSLTSNNITSPSSSENMNIKNRINELEEAIDTINEELASTDISKTTGTIDTLSSTTINTTAVNTESIEATDGSFTNVSAENTIAAKSIGVADGYDSLEVTSDTKFDENVIVRGDLEVQGDISFSNSVPNLTTDNLTAENVVATTKVQSPLVTTDEAVIDTARINNAYIDNLNTYSADEATIDTLESTDATIENATITDADIDTAEIDSLTTGSITNTGTITTDKINVASTIKQTNRAVQSGKIEMEDLQAVGNFHTIKIPVVGTFVHLSLADKTLLDQYNESQKWFDVTFFANEIGRSELVETIKHQNANLIGCYAMNDLDSIVAFEYDYENKYVYIKTNKNGFIHWQSDTEDEIEITYSENEFEGMGTAVIEYVPTNLQRTVLFGDNTTAYGMDIMGQMEAAVSPTYEIIDVITLRWNNSMVYDNERSEESETHSTGHPHDIMAKLSTQLGDNANQTGWLRSSSDRQVLRTQETEWVNDEGTLVTIYPPVYEDTVTDTDSGVLDTENDRLVSAKALETWNGKIDDGTDTDNPITKLGTVDEGEWNAGNVTTPQLEVNGTSALNGNVTIKGDLTISGSQYVTHEEDLYVESDTITLRDGASSGLQTGELSGLRIDNYDGNGSQLGVVTNASGELRIGDVDIRACYSDDGTNYYTDIDLTNPIDVSAYNLFAVGNPDPDTGVQKYEYVYDDDTEPVLTRDETADMVNNAVLAWNAADKKAYATGLIYDEATDTVSATNITATNLTATNATITNEDVTNSDITNADITSATIDDLDVTNDATVSGDLTVEGTTQLDTTNITNSNNNALLTVDILNATTGLVSQQTVTSITVDGRVISKDANGDLCIDGYPIAEWASTADKNAAANYVAMVDGNGRLQTISGSASMWIA